MSSILHTTLSLVTLMHMYLHKSRAQTANLIVWVFIIERVGIEDPVYFFVLHTSLKTSIIFSQSYS